MTLYSLQVLTHVSLGTFALATFWIAGLSKKGSPVHKAAGKIYLLAMAGLTLVALPLSLRIAFGGNPIGGAFLLYLWVITVTGVWTSWRAIRDKRDWLRYTGAVYRGLSRFYVAQPDKRLGDRCCRACFRQANAVDHRCVFRHWSAYL